MARERNFPESRTKPWDKSRGKNSEEGPASLSLAVPGKGRSVLYLSSPISEVVSRPDCVPSPAMQARSARHGASSRCTLFTEACIETTQLTAPRPRNALPSCFCFRPRRHGCSIFILCSPLKDSTGHVEVIEVTESRPPLRLRFCFLRFILFQMAFLQSTHRLVYRQNPVEFHETTPSAPASVLRAMF